MQTRIRVGKDSEQREFELSLEEEQEGRAETGKKNGLCGGNIMHIYEQ